MFRSIKNQSYENIEIIVVDRFSEDGTVEIAERYEAKVYQLDCKRVWAYKEMRTKGYKAFKGSVE